MTLRVVIAHHPGVDWLYMAAPVVVVLGWVWWAERRSRRMRSDRGGDAASIIPGDPGEDEDT